MFRIFWGSKNEANFERIFKRIKTDSQGVALTTAVACLRPKRPLGMALWHGSGMQRLV